MSLARIFCFALGSIGSCLGALCGALAYHHPGSEGALLVCWVAMTFALSAGVVLFVRNERERRDLHEGLASLGQGAVSERDESSGSSEEAE